jgi:hypothetical protein
MLSRSAGSSVPMHWVRGVSNGCKILCVRRAERYRRRDDTLEPVLEEFGGLVTAIEVSELSSYCMISSRVQRPLSKSREVVMSLLCRQRGPIDPYHLSRTFGNADVLSMDVVSKVK